MSLLSNVLFGIYLLSVIALIYFLFSNKLQRSGEAGLAYGWISLLLTAGILVITLILILLNRSPILNWPTRALAGTIVTVTALTILILSTGICSVFRFQEQPPGWFFKTVCAIVPVLNLLTLTLYLSITLYGQQSGSIVTDARPICILVVIINLLVLSSFYFAYRLERKTELANVKKSFATDENLNHDRKLLELQNFDVNTEMVFMLVFCDSTQPADLRNQAVAKVKTHPEWERELVRILGTGYYEQAFTYIASNGVDHPPLFQDEIYAAILQQATDIRTILRNSRSNYDLYTDQFSWPADRILRTVDRMPDPAFFIPAVQAMADAFEEKTKVPKPAFSCYYQINDWLHRKTKSQIQNK